MKTIWLIAATLMATGTMPVLAQDKQAAPQQAEKQAPDPDKKICRTDRSTGSLLRRTRVCMTQAEWDDQAAQSQTAVGRFVRDSVNQQGGGVSNPTPGPGH